MCRMELSLLFFLFHLSFFCLLFLFACVVLPHYVVNKDEYIFLYFVFLLRCMCTLLVRCEDEDDDDDDDQHQQQQE